MADTLRVATFNTELSRKSPGLLLRDILRGDDPQIIAVLDTLARANADIVTLQGFDYDLEGRALAAFADALAERTAAYPHRFAGPPNAGRMTDADLNANGTRGEARDAQGYGRFFGAGAMAVLSRHPIAVQDVQDFSTLLWRDLPDNLYPMQDNAPWGGTQAHAVQRLSSHSHWSLPIEHPVMGRFHVLTFHATPPVFDGPEDRNGRRNHDETAFWTLHLAGTIGTPPDAPFILMGDANADPDKGDGRPEAIRSLLSDPRLQDPLPMQPTVDWSATGQMRVDYVLPSADWRVVGAQVMAPNPDASRHRLVWVELTR